jgi:hypothetical protein
MRRSPVTLTRFGQQGSLVADDTSTARTRCEDGNRAVRVGAVCQRLRPANEPVEASWAATIALHAGGCHTSGCV